MDGVEENSALDIRNLGETHKPKKCGDVSSSSQNFARVVAPTINKFNMREYHYSNAVDFVSHTLVVVLSDKN